MLLPPSVLGGVLQAAGSVAAKVRTFPPPPPPPTHPYPHLHPHLHAQLTFGEESFVVKAAQQACASHPTTAAALDGQLCGMVVRGSLGWCAWAA